MILHCWNGSFPPDRATQCGPQFADTHERGFTVAGLRPVGEIARERTHSAHAFDPAQRSRLSLRGSPPRQQAGRSSPAPIFRMILNGLSSQDNTLITSISSQPGPCDRRHGLAQGSSPQFDMNPFDLVGWRLAACQPHEAWRQAMYRNASSGVRLPACSSRPENMHGVSRDSGGARS